MTSITFSGGKVVMKDGKVGTEQACCCGGTCCTSCIEYFFDIELYNAGCPEGWNQDTYGTCTRLRANINGSECGAAANYPIECGGECFDPDFPEFTFPCCGKVCQEPVDGPCVPCGSSFSIDCIATQASIDLLVQALTDQGWADAAGSVNGFAGGANVGTVKAVCCAVDCETFVMITLECDADIEGNSIGSDDIQVCLCLDNPLP